MHPHIFRAYDIRGLAEDELTPAAAERIGAAFATHIRRRGGKTLAVGRDSRPSSPAIYEAIIAGVRTAGIDVTALGLTPSPVAGFAAAAWALDGAVNVTASHNPVRFNGLKLVRRGAAALLPEEIQELRALAESGDFERGRGALVERDPKPEYVAMLEQRFPVARTLRVVADPGNGVATLTGPAALRGAGCEVVGLYTELLEGFPNHLPNPQAAETMADLGRAVIEHGADCGFAWDGDGDRVGLIDETGRRHEADWIVALLARDLLRRHPGARILLDSKCSLGASRAIRARGGEPILTRTGYTLLRRRMAAEGILFGGEASGHIIFGEDYYGIDDGVYAACAIACILAAEDRPLSAHFEQMQAGMPPLFTSREIMMPCADAAKFRVAAAVNARLRAACDGPAVAEEDLRLDFGDGWALVRASNTNPVLSVRFEAESRDRYDAIRVLIWEAVGEHAEVTIPESVGEPA